jgi:hypothetical protein
MLRRILLLVLITFSIIISGCGDDAKSLVRSSLDDKSGVKISEVYNKKKDDEKSKFAKEVTIAYFEQAKSDLSRKNNPSYTQYFYDTLTDLFKHIDPNDKNFANLSKLNQLISLRESKVNEYGNIYKQLGLSLEKDGLSYSNAGSIRRYRLYINHRVFNNDYNPLYGAVEPQTIGNGFIGTMEIPSDKYVAAVHIPKDGVFANGPGVYTFYAAQAGNYTLDVAGFPRNVMLLQLIYDDQVNLVRRFVRLDKERNELLKTTIPNYVNNVLADPGGEFRTGVASIDNKKADNSNKNISPTASQSAASVATRAEDALVNFHSAITNKQYQTAFNLLSPSMQNYVGGYDKFVRGYGTTESSQITEINVISKNDSAATLAYMLEARDKFKAGTLIQQFSGTAKLINNGGWRISEVTAKKVGERLIQ